MAWWAKHFTASLSLTSHDLQPREVLHFDHLFVGEGEEDMKYALFIKDDGSGYLWLSATSVATAIHGAYMLSRWQRTFTIPQCSVSDQGSHFMDNVRITMADSFNIQHHPTVVYSPWVNGTILRLNHYFLQPCVRC